MWRASQPDADAEAVEVPALGSDTKVHLRGSSDSLEGALAALGTDLVQQLCPGAKDGAPGHPLQLSCRGNDRHSLVLSWIETLIYLLEERQVGLADIQVRLGQTMSLSASCETRTLQYGSLLVPKALDPTSARAMQSEDGQWRTECTLLMHPKNAL